jgi:hypothetical protein
MIIAGTCESLWWLP